MTTLIIKVSIIIFLITGGVNALNSLQSEMTETTSLRLQQIDATVEGL